MNGDDKDNIPDMAVFANRLNHIDEAISGVGNDIKTILEKLGQQNGDLIKAKTEIDYLKKEIKDGKENNEKEIKEIKETQEKEIKILWEELRRKEESRKEDEKSRDVKQRWWVTTIIGGIVIIWSIIQYLLK